MRRPCAPRTRLLAALIGAAVALPAAAERDHTGIWWNPEESGWGLFTVDQGSVLLPTWYTYDADGEATWFIVAGALPQDDGSYVGEVFRFTGVPFSDITGNAADPGEAVGSASFQFEGDHQVIFDYEVDGNQRSITMERFDFGDRDVHCEPGDGSSRAGLGNYTDLWWNPEQNGWGANLTHLDDTIYVTWYTYGEDREAIWFLGAATLQDDGSYAGDLFRGSSGTPYFEIDGQPPSPDGPVQVGTFSLEFSDGENGTLVTNVDGLGQIRPISRLLAGDAPPVCQSRPADDSLVQCFPQLSVDDRFRRVTRIDPDLPDVPPIVSSRDHVVVDTDDYQGTPVFVVETEFATLPGTPVARALVADDGAARTTFTEDVLFIDDGSVAGTRSFEPPEVMPSLLRLDESVNLDTTISSDAPNEPQTQVIVRSWTLTGFETAETFAGTFDGACRIEVEQEIVSTEDGLETREISTGTLWAHPLVGEVIFEYSGEVTRTGNGVNESYHQEVRRTLGRAIVDGVDYPATR